MHSLTMYVTLLTSFPSYLLVSRADPGSNIFKWIGLLLDDDPKEQAFISPVAWR